jgi:pimeloyl-ACP methyl ester carboxylesterase
MTTPRIDISGRALEVLDIPGDAGGPLLLIHGGLGSAQLWGAFPAKLAAATGRRTVAFSRLGHGWSDPPPKSRTPRFMHEEARDVVPEVVAALGLQDPILVGHSDGASIALLYASERPVRAVAVLAPHVFVEQVCLDEISQVRDEYTDGDMRARMAVHHRDVDVAFAGWAGVWLDPEFRGWDIRDRLSDVRAPLLLIQGTRDQFGTLAQLDEIERLAAGPVERLHLDCRHAPFVQAQDETVQAVAQWSSRLPIGR